jgi:DNA mismatch repair protein MutL
MGKIRKLSILEAQKIAAGEVVERPANVVKELIENAIDAGASTITLYIEDGGHSCIRCVDDGSGMDEDDLFLCIEHHATSKMNMVDEISTLLTNGFRGEALSSIASVSRMSITSCTNSACGGTKISLHAGTIINHEVCSASRGTDISVCDIFYNLPARRKFLRKSETEFRSITHVISALALFAPSISFIVYNDNRLYMQLIATNDYSERVAEVMGAQFSKNSLGGSSSSVVAEYVIAHSGYSWYDRSRIYIAVNGRLVKNSALISAFIRAYKSMLPAGKYPAGVVRLQIAPEYIDVNVHPRKEEVLLLHSRQVEMAIEKVVREALAKWAHGAGDSDCRVQHESNFFLFSSAQNSLQNNTNQDSSFFTIDNKSAARKEHLSSIYQQYNNQNNIQIDSLLTNGNALLAAKIYNSADNSAVLSVADEFETYPILQKKYDNGENCADSVSNSLNTFDCDHDLHNTLEHSTQQNSIEMVQQEIQPYRIIGQVFNAYIIVEQNKQLVFIDQHAAMERVLYQKFLKNIETGQSIQLVAPQFVTFDTEYVSILESFIPLLEQIGLRLDVFSATKIIVRAMPLALKDQVVADILFEISMILKNSDTTKDSLVELLYHKLGACFSCKKAIKAGNVLQQVEIEHLVADWYALSDEIACPHGRPTFFVLSQHDINKAVRR